MTVSTERIEFRCGYWLAVLWGILCLAPTVSAFDVTVNSTAATAGTNYQDFDVFLSALQNGALLPAADTNTVTFTDTAPVTFTMSNDLSPTTNRGVVVFRGQQNHPDLFPVLNHTSGDWYNYLSLNDVVFERLTFTGTKQFRSGSGTKVRIFRNCVIRNFADPAISFLLVEGDGTSTTILENCMVYNNVFTTGTLELAPWNTSSPVVIIVNCTFHNTGTVFYSNNAYQNSATTIFNCLFSSSGAVNGGSADVRPGISYSVTKEDVTVNGYGTGCLSGDPVYKPLEPGVGREHPSQFALASSSPARNIGVVTVNAITAPVTDISGALRSDDAGKRDAGCWDVLQPPVFTTNLPADTMVPLSTRLVLRVAAAGSVPLVYSWHRVGMQTVLSSADSLVDTIQADDDGMQYYCIVKNSIDSVSSDTVQLSVPAEIPEITSHTGDTAVTEGSSLLLKVVASGYPSPTYTWTVAETVPVLSSSDSLTLNALSPTTGIIYRCVVTNSAGSDTADITVIVNQTTAALITAEPKAEIIIRLGGTYTLSVTATGATPLDLTWYKDGFASSDSIGTGPTYTISAATEEHAGSYWCIARNAYGSDATGMVVVRINSATVYNTLDLSARAVTANSVKAGISNFRDLPTEVGTGPRVDSIGIWYSYVTFPGAPLSSASTSCTAFPLSQLLAGVSDTFTTTINVPLAEGCSTPLYLVTAPIWKNPDSVPPALTVSQRSTAIMCSNDYYQNLMVLNLSYTPLSDSILVTISNTGSITADPLMYLLIEYRKGTGTYAANPGIKILPSEIPAGGTVVSSIHNAAFAGIEDSVRVMLKWRSANGNFSVPVTRLITVGRSRPVNTALLTADSSSVESIYLHWEFSSPADIDSTRIWWSRQQLPTAADIDPSTIPFLAFGPTIKNATVTGLLSNTKYYLGVQVFSNGVGSYLPLEAQDTISTKSSLVAAIPNTIKLTALSFDSVTNTFSVEWDVGTDGVGDITTLETGILYGIGKPPAVTGVTDADFTLIIPDLKETGNSATVDPGSQLRFTAAYYFALLLRVGGGAWTTVTDSSVDSVSTTPPSHQVVTYFTGGEDTVTVFNNQVMLWKTGTGVVNVTDTVRTFDPGSPQGCIVVGIGVDFAGDFRSDPVALGISYDTTRLAGYPQRAVRLYQYNSLENAWYLLDGCVVDSVGKYVYFTGRLNEHPWPFVAMIDTVAPQVSLVSSPSVPVTAGITIRDTIVISDNIANTSVKLYYWGGVVQGSSNNCKKTYDTVLVSIPGDSVITDRGISAELMISDGNAKVTIDISRSVIRTTSDPVVLVGGQWTPVITTAFLTDSSVEGSLHELCPQQPWLYDSTLFLIYRWYDRNGVVPSPDLPFDTANKWIEFAQDTRSLFSMVPGKVLWIKTLSTINIQSLGGGTTVPLNDDFIITLKAKQWNDIAIPFRFNVTIGDVVAATDSVTPLWDSLYVYKWKLPSDNNPSVTIAKFVRTIPGINSLAEVFNGTSGYDGLGTYSILNLSSQDVALHIPPLPQSFSSYGNTTIGKKHTQQGSHPKGWSVAVRAAAGGTELAPVYCGFTPGNGASGYPVSPSFGKQRVSVLHPGDGRRSGHLVLHETVDNGCLYRIAFSNDAAGLTDFDCTVDAATSLPDGYEIAWYDPGKRSIIYNPKDVRIPVAGNTESGRWLMVGDSSFIASLSRSFAAPLSLLKVYPNPCRRELNIHYTVPDADIRQLQIALYDQLGRRVWFRSAGRSSFTTGLNTLRLYPGNSTIGAGTYILRIAAVTAQGKVYGYRQHRILMVP